MKIKGTHFTIGADPEMFVRHRASGEIVGAHGLIRGTKENPVALPGTLCEGQVDGMALEFNTWPSSTVESFSIHISQGKTGLWRAVNRGAIARNRFYDLAVVATAEFSPREWDRAPEEAKILGCDPDFNAWEEQINNPPNAKVTFRTAAGHVHMGWGRRFVLDDDFFKVCAAFAREMDATVGVASLLWDQDTKRRELYGKAGAFRPKPYGMEYRTLSNSWVRYAGLAAYVARRSFDAARNMMNQKLIQTAEARHIIDGNRVEDAKHWLRKHNITFPPAKHRVD